MKLHHRPERLRRGWRPGTLLALAAVGACTLTAVHATPDGGRVPATPAPRATVDPAGSLPALHTARLVGRATRAAEPGRYVDLGADLGEGEGPRGLVAPARGPWRPAAAEASGEAPWDGAGDPGRAPGSAAAQPYERP